MNNVKLFRRQYDLTAIKGSAAVEFTVDKYGKKEYNEYAYFCILGKAGGIYGDKESKIKSCTGSVCKTSHGKNCCSEQPYRGIRKIYEAEDTAK